MILRAPPVFRPDEFPDADPKLLELVTRGFRDLNNAVTALPGITFREGLNFTTGSSGTAYLDVGIAPAPAHLWVTRLWTDAGEITSPYSQTWTRTNNGARLLFAGLSSDMKHFASVGYA